MGEGFACHPECVAVRELELLLKCDCTLEAAPRRRLLKSKGAATPCVADRKQRTRQTRLCLMVFTITLFREALFESQLPKIDSSLKYSKEYFG